MALFPNLVQGQLGKALLEIGKLYLQERGKNELEYIDFSECIPTSRYSEPDKTRIRDSNCRNGWGMKRIREESLDYYYYGEFQNGRYHGVGSLIFANGRTDELDLLYEGQFSRGQKNGFGKEYDHYTTTSKTLGLRTTRMVRSGYYYQGNFENDQRSGKGIYYYPSGSIKYSGSYQRGSMSGEGKLYTKKGELEYEGKFSRGTRSGQGTAYFTGYSRGAGKKKYEGMWYNDKYDGYGTLYFSDGMIDRIGEFQRGSTSGEVKLYKRTGGLEFDGTLEDQGSFGRGRYYYSSNRVFEGKWDYQYQHRFKGPYVAGRVKKGAEARRGKHIRAQEWGYAQKKVGNSVLFYHFSYLGGMFDPGRFEGARKLFDPFGWPRNYEIGLQTMGLKLSRWHRLNPFVFINARTYTLDRQPFALYVPDFMVLGADSLGHHELWLDNGEERSPAILVNQELGVGANLWIPTAKNVWFLVGGGAVVWQRTNMRFDDQPFEDQSLFIARRRVRNVLDHPPQEFFGVFGINIDGFQIDVRTYYRGSSMVNSNSPLFNYDLDAERFDRHQIFSAKQRIRPQLNVSMNLGVVQRRSKLSRDKYKYNLPLYGKDQKRRNLRLTID